MQCLPSGSCYLRLSPPRRTPDQANPKSRTIAEGRHCAALGISGEQILKNLKHLKARLEAEASAFVSRRSTSRQYVVFDIEYLYDRVGQKRADRHAAEPNAVNDNPAAAFKVRWPFHRIVCIVAMAIAVGPYGTVTIEALNTWSRAKLTEAGIIQAFSDFLAARCGAVPVTWGGENKDLPAILAVAMRDGIALSSCISDPHWKHSRIDLCSLLCGQAEKVHLNEYAHAQGLPAKLLTPRALGEAAEGRHWPAVGEHCEVDVTITAMLLVRWLLATGHLKESRSALDAAIADTVAQLRPYRPQLLETLAGFRALGFGRAA